MSNDAPDLSRRAVLKAIAALTACPLISACEFVDIKDKELADQTPFSLSDPALAGLEEVGNTACFNHGAQEILLVRANNDEVLAFSRFCPHNNLSMGECGGNPLPGQWDADEQTLTCQWHLSVFDRDGKLVRPPNTDQGFDEPISVFHVEFDPATGEGTIFSS